MRHVGLLLHQTVPLAVALFVFYVISGARAMEENCRLRRIVHRIDYNECRPKRLFSFACQGGCRSYTEISTSNDAELVRHCTCCQQSGSVTRDVSVLCRDPDKRRGYKRVVMRLKVPTGCMCRPCYVGDDVEPQEFSELGDKRNLWTILS